MPADNRASKRTEALAMTTIARRCTASLLGLLLCFGAVPSPGGAQPAAPAPSSGAATADGAIGRTPPRLSYVEGEVSFWRPGASDWAPAQLNTALAPGDETYTGNGGNLELQVGTRAFVRSWGDTQLGLVNQEPDFVQLKVTAGHVALDLRTVEPGRTVEVDTPSAAFTIDAPGYYRVDVTPERTSFITRRSGRATMTPAGGTAMAIASSEEIVLDGAASPAIQSYVAPALDVWDNWNYARTEELIDSLSARYVSAGVYGVDDLDHYGAWRVVPTYGSVWVPRGVAADWAPYSSGRWVGDPYYGWTWVDQAPWGWAPYHYGRWVYVDGYWAWAPGPLVVRPVYAPALVAFFGAGGVRVAVGTPFVSWVALGWGEPVIPWWGGPRVVGHPHWAGWGGPRVVNNVVVQRTTVVNVQNITVYRNTNVHNAVVAVREDAFGRRDVHEARVADVDVHKMQPVRGRLRVTPDSSSFVAAHGPAVKPPAQVVERQVVATRRPVVSRVVATEPGREREAPVVQTPTPRIVPAPKPSTTVAAPAPRRAPFGSSTVERERVSTPPRFESRVDPRAGAPRTESRAEPPRAEPQAQTPRSEPQAQAPRVEPQPPRTAPQAEAPRPEPRAQVPQPQPRAEASRPDPRAEAARAQARPPETREVGRPQAPGQQRGLPGEPANRVSPYRRESSGPHASTPAPAVAPAPTTRAPAVAPERANPGRGPAKAAGGRDERRER
jgi:hypothetical protein